MICAEGYLFELERRGYLQAGAFVPEVVLDHPEEVTALHGQFVHAGSDIVEAFTYYGHREKLRIVGKEHLLEPLNRTALQLAAEVARHTGTLLAGNICNTNIYEPDSDGSAKAVRAMFDEQVGWAAEAGVDLIIAETISWVDEALIALESIRAAGLPAVVTMAMHQADTTRDGYSVAEACRALAGAGADVVGLNCGRGPATMLPLIAEIVEAVDVPVAALPVPYRTTAEQPTFQSLAIPPTTAIPPGSRSPPASTHSPALATSSPTSPAVPASSAPATSASAAAPDHTTSAPSPRRSAARRRPAGTPRTCPSTPTSAPTLRCTAATGSTPPTCRASTTQGCGGGFGGSPVDLPAQLGEVLGDGRRFHRCGAHDAVEVPAQRAHVLAGGEHEVEVAEVQGRPLAAEHGERRGVTARPVEEEPAERRVQLVDESSMRSSWARRVAAAAGPRHPRRGRRI